MLLATQLERVFILKDNGQEIRLTDPEPKWSVESVINFYANTYPILTTAKVSAPQIKDDTIQYKFESVMGTKGYIPYFRQENSYLYWNYEMLTDWLDEDEEIDENHLNKKELQQAEILGDIMEQKISHRKNLVVFKKRLEQFKSKGDFDKECFQLSEKAFQVYTDYPEESVFRNLHFNNIPKQENGAEDECYDEETVISMGKYVFFFADDKGWVYQNLIDCVNNEFNEYAELQEPMIFKAFNGSDITKNNLDLKTVCWRF